MTHHEKQLMKLLMLFTFVTFRAHMCNSSHIYAIPYGSRTSSPSPPAPMLLELLACMTDALLLLFCWWWVDGWTFLDL